MSGLAERVAIITGGGTGIGRAVASTMAALGAHVVICGRRADVVTDLAREATSTGLTMRAVVADVSVEADVRRVVAEAYDNYGAVDILVNNAGVFKGGAIHGHDVDDWDRVMAVNLRGPFLMSRAVLPIMRAQARGHIVNISSESGIEHYPTNGAYGVSKHALNALGEYIQRENQDLGIKVNTICPGVVLTDMNAATGRPEPANCLLPEDIAELVLWLVTRRDNIKIGTPVLMQTMRNPWRAEG